MQGRSVVLYIAMSLDGYIADEKQGIGFLGLVEKAGEDYGYSAFSSTTDVVILGRKTWDTVLLFNIPVPYEGKKVYVISRSRQGTQGVAEYYNGELPALIHDLKARQGLDIYIDGGSEIVHSLLKDRLIDKLIISVIPVLLGNGVPLFKPPLPQQKLTLLQRQSYPSGLLQLTYKVDSDKLL